MIKTINQQVAAMIARALADMGVTTVFGVISIHNMPILDAIHTQNRIRFVPARGEAGAMNMADAYARVSETLGVCITSTGTGAGNAAGAQVEALTAGSRVLHITTTVDSPYADRDKAAIHDVPRQPDMLKAISKAYFRIQEAANAQGVLQAAVTAAYDAPSGPVSLEIPVDVQRMKHDYPTSITLSETMRRAPAKAHIETLMKAIKQAKRPMLWLGGGAHHASTEATALADKGFGIVTSTHGRAVVPEAHKNTLGAFNMSPESDKIYAACDLMIVVGSRLRGNETKDYKLKLPKPLVQIDADASQGGRNIAVDLFIHGDAQLTLKAINDALDMPLSIDPQFHYDIAVARAKEEGALRTRLGPYQVVADALQTRVTAGDHAFVRDVTISNSTFGNRYVQYKTPNLGVHALGGGIGQGLAMAIGASLAKPSTKTIALVGDGGLMLGIAELGCLVDEKCEAVIILMNDQAYGVIENIQDAQYEGRRVYSKLGAMKFDLACASVGLNHVKVSDIHQFEAVLDAALAHKGATLIEVDMVSIGPFAVAFAGPPAGAAGVKP
jgi:acetolactate synthase I/II/III large subunit